MSADGDAQLAATAASPEGTLLPSQGDLDDVLQETDPWAQGRGSGAARMTGGAATEAPHPEDIPSFERRRGQGAQAENAPTFAQVTLPAQDQPAWYMLSVFSVPSASRLPKLSSTLMWSGSLVFSGIQFISF